MTDSTPDSTTKPAPGKPRNPVLWLVVGLPAVVIVASLTTLYIAINAGGSDAIPDEVRRTAQIQTTELGPDERAATLKLSAVFSVREGHVEVLPASGALVDDKALRGQPLRLLLQHPTLAAEDRELKLAPTEAGWRAEIALDPSHDWRIQLAPEGTAWRLRGRLPAGQRGVLLAPAVGDVPAAATDAR
jgi:hypothetical protein